MLFLSTAQPEEIQHFDNPAIALELRLDLFPYLKIENIRDFLKTTHHPVMLTLRKKSQGGHFWRSEQEREVLISQLLNFNPPFFDLECDTQAEFIREKIQKHPNTKIILSYHNFQETPAELNQIISSIQVHQAHAYKIATFTNSTNDALRMLIFAKKHPQVNVICMGEKGSFARVLGPVVGNSINYASTDDNQRTAPGQLSVKELNAIYNYPTLNQETAIYGLIGDPVQHSQGHFYHNARFQKMGLNAVYVKMLVQPDELAEFISLAKDLGIRGLSVTAPLKEAVIPFIDHMDYTAKQIGAVNTLLFEKEGVKGINTDGAGALDVIEKRVPIHGKNVVLLGAGGSARAIAFEAKMRGAHVLVVNRTVARAQKLAIDIGCALGEVDDIPKNYDVLINCTSNSMPINPDKIQPGTIAMDVTYNPRETLFLKAAAVKGCQIIYGEEMFLNQAMRQTAFWIGK